MWSLHSLKGGGSVDGHSLEHQAFVLCGAAVFQGVVETAGQQEGKRASCPSGKLMDGILSFDRLFEPGWPEGPEGAAVSSCVSASSCSQARWNEVMMRLAPAKRTHSLAHGLGLNALKHLVLACS